MPSTRTAPIAAFAWGALVLTACGSGGSTSASLPSGCEQVAKPPPKHVNLKPPKKRAQAGQRLSAAVETSCGSFVIALDSNGSPKTVSSFVYLADKGVYDDTAFHRIVPNFIIQGGDPQGNGTGGPGYSVDERPPAKTRYTQGTVAMAKAPIEPPGRSGSQFFVVLSTDAGLPPQYAVLGHVSSGMDVVKRIGSLGDPSSGEQGIPKATVVIRKIAVKGG